MGRIVGGIGVSHAPSLARAYDQGLGDDPAWRDVFEGYEPAARWLAELDPDALVIVYNDHVNRFFFDCVSDVRSRGGGRSFPRPTRAGASGRYPTSTAIQPSAGIWPTASLPTNSI